MVKVFSKSDNKVGHEFEFEYQILQFNIIIIRRLKCPPLDLGYVWGCHHVSRNRNLCLRPPQKNENKNYDDNFFTTNINLLLKILYCYKLTFLVKRDFLPQNFI